MSRKLLLLMLLALLIGTLNMASTVEKAKASGTIYIRADGSIDPPTANITTFDNVTYAFTGSIYDEIVVERSNIVVEGDGNVLQGAGLALAPNSKGIYSYGTSNVTIKNLEIRSFETGILLNSTSFTVLSQNNITDNLQGVGLWQSSNDSISGNNITKNLSMSSLSYSANNTLTENTMEKLHIEDSFGNAIVGNTIGMIEIVQSSKNTFYHNNVEFEEFFESYDNEWDDGYPLGGNYWSDYNGTDSNGDGIGDIPYTIDANNTDHYPLMGMFYGFNVSWIDSGYDVELISNSSISTFDVGFWIEHPEDPNRRIIKFNVTGETGTAGFCRICIPTALLNASYTVLLNGTEIPCTLLPCSNSTHSYLYFNYTHSTKEIVIVPEFAPLFILPLFMITILLTVTIYRKKQTR